MDWSSLGSSVHGISQARILEWVAISFSRDLPYPGIKPRYPAVQVDGLLTDWANKINVIHFRIYLILFCIESESERASLVAQRVKRLPAVWETRVQSLRREDPWRRKWQPTPIFLLGKLHRPRSLVSYSPWRCKESDTTVHKHMFTFI